MADSEGVTHPEKGGRHPPNLQLPQLITLQRNASRSSQVAEKVCEDMRFR